MGRSGAVGLATGGTGCDRCGCSLDGEVVELRETGEADQPAGRLCHGCYARLLSRREIEAVRVEKAGAHRSVVVLEVPELSRTRNG
jgi:hypothetical protein